jgi:D-alanyl-D-alanine carboxypeptidase/D-alanyl-D-alanine-endopeptidase (penicillin-binding protein 4)
VAKILTTTAALASIGPDAVLTTRVVQGATPSEIVLVGGGDPTLTASVERSGTYPAHASLRALASAVATNLRAGGVTRVALRIDDSLFTGPRVSPAWPAGYITSGVVAPVSALAVDEGRVKAGANPRVADPAVAAGRQFAALLQSAGISVAPGIARTVVKDDSLELGAVDSPPLDVLVEEALSRSDNDLAEALARHVAIASELPASFEGAARGIAGELERLAIPTAGLRLLDGSGLARGSRVAPITLSSALTVAASGTQPRLRAVVTGLPVAGFSGTLADRFVAPGSARAVGSVRAKTGTLTGVSSLAGTVYDADGQLLVFVVMADAVPAGNTLAARRVLDRFAATLTTCGCR